MQQGVPTVKRVPGHWSLLHGRQLCARCKVQHVLLHSQDKVPFELWLFRARGINGPLLMSVLRTIHLFLDATTECLVDIEPLSDRFYTKRLLH